MSEYEESYISITHLPEFGGSTTRMVAPGIVTALREHMRKDPPPFLIADAGWFGQRVKRSHPWWPGIRYDCILMVGSALVLLAIVLMLRSAGALVGGSRVGAV